MTAQATLKTSRLVLRPLTFEDALSIQTFASVRELADAMISIPHPYPNGEAEQYISKQLAEFEASHSVTFVIERKSESVFSGIIEVRDIEREHSQAELSFWLAVEAWGQGYMSEALKPVLHFAFEDLCLNRLYGYHMVRNPASGKVFRKTGLYKKGCYASECESWEYLRMWRYGQFSTEIGNVKSNEQSYITSLFFVFTRS